MERLEWRDWGVGILLFKISLNPRFGPHSFYRHDESRNKFKCDMGEAFFVGGRRFVNIGARLGRGDDFRILRCADDGIRLLY